VRRGAVCVNGARTDLWEPLGVQPKGDPTCIVAQCPASSLLAILAASEQEDTTPSDNARPLGSLTTPVLFSWFVTCFGARRVLLVPYAVKLQCLSCWLRASISLERDVFGFVRVRDGCLAS
jgi:hypothetical protein